MEHEVTPIVTLPDSQERTIHIALELSKSRWLIGIHSPLTDKVSRHSVAGGDADALLRRIDRVREALEQTLGAPARLVSCYEAGHDGFWLHRLLLSHGIENHVMDPASLPGREIRTTTAMPVQDFGSGLDCRRSPVE
jgi:transposase